MRSVGTWVLFQYPIRRLIVKSRGRDIVSWNHQISERSDNSKHKSRGFETLRDFTVRRLIWYWNGALHVHGTDTWRELLLPYLRIASYPRYWYKVAHCFMFQNAISNIKRCYRPKRVSKLMVVLFRVGIDECINNQETALLWTCSLIVFQIWHVPISS